MNTMTNIYMRLFGVFFLMLSLTGCSKDELSMADEVVRGNDLPVMFEVGIDHGSETRGIINESKQSFVSGDYIHLRVEFTRMYDNNPAVTYVDAPIYTMLQCTNTTLNQEIHNVTWQFKSGEANLIWPNDAVSASFEAYYIAGSTGPLSGNTSAPVLLSEYKAADIPLSAKAEVKYGETAILNMKRIFSLLTITDIQEGISNDMWFSLPESQRGQLHNAFHLVFEEEGYKMTPTFETIRDQTYKEVDGEGLICVKAHKFEPLKDGEVDDGSAQGISFFLEPGLYTQFCILYPRTSTQYSTYLDYNNDLSKMLQDNATNPKGELLPNGRYVFSVLRSLGVSVKEKPEEGWDNSDPYADIDVEKFLRAMVNGDDYYEDDEDGNPVQFLEKIEGGTRLLRNISFKHEYYETFGEDAWRPSPHNIFDGNNHYIYDLSCPFIFENYGTIKNVGFRNISTSATDKNPDNHPIVSQISDTHPENTEMSYNGIIASRNMSDGVIDNVRIIDADMTVQIKTNDDSSISAEEAHNVAFLVGSNQGRITHIGLAGKFKLTVENYPEETEIPRVVIGGMAAQNMNLIQGVSYITDEKEPDLEMPEISIVNKCKGASGVYWVGGLVGNNTGTLDDLFVPEVKLDGTASQGLVSRMGGLVGKCTKSSPAAQISGCIVRGEVKSGTINSMTNISSFAYTGGVAGEWYLQASLTDCSVSVDVYDTSQEDPSSEYGQGGVFGAVENLVPGSGDQAGEIGGLTCVSTALQGNGSNVGNFAGIVPTGYDWEYWQQFEIYFKQHSNVGKNIGLVK